MRVGARACVAVRAVTRWREDRTRDPGSQFIYLRDVHSGEVWSATHQPIGEEADDYLVEFVSEKATFERRDHDIEHAPRDRRLCRRTTPRCAGSP